MYNASKWLKHPVLLGDEEMERLISSLPDFSIHAVSDVVMQDEISKEEFLHHYQDYVRTLKRGEIPDGKKVRKIFSSVFTTDKELLQKKEVKKDHFLVKPMRPVVQLQFHHFLPSHVDGKFYPMVVSQESISWGIQFSYPQLFQEPATCQIVKVDSSFPNTAFFHQLVRYLKKESLPTTFLWKDQKTSTSIRLGKQCFPWIACHPQLLKKGIQVHVY